MVSYEVIAVEYLNHLKSGRRDRVKVEIENFLGHTWRADHCRARTGGWVGGLGLVKSCHDLSYNRRKTFRKKTSCPRRGDYCSVSMLSGIDTVVDEVHSPEDEWTHE
jgi:hypothetical protein